MNDFLITLSFEVTVFFLLPPGKETRLLYIYVIVNLLAHLSDNRKPVFSISNFTYRCISL